MTATRSINRSNAKTACVRGKHGGKRVKQGEQLQPIFRSTHFRAGEKRLHATLPCRPAPVHQAGHPDRVLGHPAGNCA